MHKIHEVVQAYKLPVLNGVILDYLQKHNDEIFSAADAESLGALINHDGKPREIVHVLWELCEKGLISKERVGKLVYFGSEAAISELRKQTRSQKRGLDSSQRSADIIVIPESIPLALTHTLQVIHLVKKYSYSRVNATIEVARKWNVSRQNIQDKYGRQTGLSASEFDKLLQKSDMQDLKSVLKTKYPDYQRYIDNFLNKL